MSHIFFNCKSLTNINLSNFNTQNVTNYSHMFYGCHNLEKENVITTNNNIKYLIKDLQRSKCLLF